MALSDDVKKLEEEAQAMGRLCGEIIAALTLPQNIESGTIHPKLLEVARRWQKRYADIRLVPDPLQAEEETPPTPHRFIPYHTEAMRDYNPECDICGEVETHPSHLIEKANA